MNARARTDEAPKKERRRRTAPWKYRVMAERRAAAEERQAARAARGDEGQLARLDDLLGPGKGAQRERARLVDRLGVTFGGEKAA